MVWFELKPPSSIVNLYKLELQVHRSHRVPHPWRFASFVCQGKARKNGPIRRLDKEQVLLRKVSHRLFECDQRAVLYCGAVGTPAYFYPSWLVDCVAHNLAALCLRIEYCRVRISLAQGMAPLAIELDRSFSEWCSVKGQGA